VILSTLTSILLLVVNPYAALLAKQCDQTASFRTIDGTCNNINRPLNGAAKTPLNRLAISRYEDGEYLTELSYLLVFVRI